MIMLIFLTNLSDWQTSLCGTRAVGFYFDYTLFISGIFGDN